MKLCVAIAALLLLASPAQAAGNATASAFVKQLYATYANGGTGPQPMAQKADTVFAPALAKSYAALMQEEVRQQAVLGPDSDPFCGCDDPSGASFTTSVAPQDKPDEATATVIVDFKNAVPPPPSAVVTLSLVRLKGGWRVANIYGPQIADLQAAWRDTLPAR